MKMREEIPLCTSPTAMILQHSTPHVNTNMANKEETAKGSENEEDN